MALVVLEEIYVHVMWWLGAFSVESMTMFEEAPPPPSTTPHTGQNPELIESISHFKSV